jgi:hypothetical protein
MHCKTKNVQSSENESGLVLVSDKAPALFPLVLVHFFLALLDNTGQEEIRGIGERTQHEGS